MKNRFMEQMEENVKYNLIYPYHIDFEKYLDNEYHNEKYPDTYHKHSFEEVLHIAYMEPFALYLTEEDKKFYSEQEIVFIEKVKEDEGRKLNNGMELVTLNLSEETQDLIDNYKLKYKMTFEEAIIDILKKIIENKESFTTK